ncbi:SpoIVB peptidase [Neobittarella massiliensis]|uniref:SpoIVB peptidase n=2 Tax=Oscillospiraceae TaxID=216572 RepID=A0A8J6IPA1_9FIRM|nr:SpoIVB peptidase [Neobittarella massiliensis]MBC3516400.1 SpoIVB peptidase [Neobittarella massiliensis]SCJ87700.1 SpoIVB peptidase precursor [uncultured Anaerotruncus sp.]
MLKKHRGEHEPRRPVKLPAMFHRRAGIKGWVQRLAAAALAVTMPLFGAVSYYQKTLPDSFYMQSADSAYFSGNELLHFSSGTGQKAAEASTGLNQNFFTDVNLFGVIPIKDVHVSVADKPQVVVSGEPFGVKMFTDGVVVVGISPVQTKSGSENPGEKAGLKVGDVIVQVNSQTVKSNDDLIALARTGDKLNIHYRRDGSDGYTSIQPVESKDGGYKIGIWVRDSTAGIGTMTFIDATRGVFAGLGHGISDSDTREIMPLENGEIVDAAISGVKKGKAGTPGELRGNFFNSSVLGSLKQNGETGVYGQYYRQAEGETLPIAYKQEVKAGAAQILTTIDGETPTLYDIEIEKVGLNDREKTRNMVIHITDGILLSKTGGIVQGMSGSPILQNGQLVGAVTHVLVNDPTRGYGIFAENMYDTARQIEGNAQ